MSNDHRRGRPHVCRTHPCILEIGVDAPNRAFGYFKNPENHGAEHFFLTGQVKRVRWEFESRLNLKSQD